MNFKHGMRRAPIYGVWSSMRSRCQNPSDRAYPNYGGRGLVVCERWQIFAHFLEDMGPCPKGSSLDRIDNAQGYSPENCRWASRSEQNRNKRNNVLLTIDGETLALPAWAERFGLKYQTLARRISKGWPAEVAVKTPVTKDRKSRRAERGVQFGDEARAA